ncbi:MAG: hypothetical protein ACLPX9_08330 [Rhodomicrobium sp.]
MIRALLAASVFVALAQGAIAQQGAPEPPRFYLSQGEWKGAVLTESGHEIIADVVKSAAAVPVTVFDINTLADMAATPAAQRRIADARAAAVREELVRGGVAPGDIVVQQVETADGSVPPLPPEQARRVIVAVHY